MKGARTNLLPDIFYLNLFSFLPTILSSIGSVENLLAKYMNPRSTGFMPKEIIFFRVRHKTRKYYLLPSACLTVFSSQADGFIPFQLLHLYFVGLFGLFLFSGRRGLLFSASSTLYRRPIRPFSLFKPTHSSPTLPLTLSTDISEIILHE